MHAERHPRPPENEIVSLPYEADALRGFSRQSVEWHHDSHYASYIKGREAAAKKLAEMHDKDDWTDVRGVKRNESHNASGQVLHEMYFAILGGDGEADPELPVRARIEEDFGSFDAWIAELKAIADQARGWAITCWDPSDGRLHVYLADGNDGGAVWGAQPIIPLDVAEHAYYYDFGPNRAAYVEAFLANLNWKAIDQYYRRAAGI
jgi:Fe-Mn family superoxide dismutase